jgi:hypothetical protein
MEVLENEGSQSAGGWLRDIFAWLFFDSFTGIFIFHDIWIEI